MKAAQMFGEEGNDVILREADSSAPRTSDLVVNGEKLDVYTPKSEPT
jgi:hypothetical protein